MTRQVELPGGCICCLLDEDLGKTIRELLDESPEIAMIAIETTGVAEPVPISWTLGTEPLDRLVRLAAVVTVVDALEHERHRPMSASVDAQVEDADILAVAKCDLASESQVAALVESLRSRNRHAPILTGSPDAVVDRLREVLGDPSPRATPPRPPAPGERHQHIESIAVPISAVLDFEELAEKLQELPADVLRIKGIADVIDEGSGWDSPTRVVFHRVGARVSAEPLDPGRGGEPRLVAIGYHLERAALARCIDESAV
jgi:G3E family GTPase